MVAQAAFSVLIKPDRNFSYLEFEPGGFQNHLRGIFPGLRFKIDPFEGLECHGSHAAMDVGISGSVNQIENPGGQRGAEIAVQRRHGAGLDVACKSAAHDKIVTLFELLHEGLEQSEVVSQVAVAHNQILAANVWHSVNISPAQASLWNAQNAGPVRLGNFGRAIGGAVDNQNLAAHAGITQALVAPLHKFADTDLFIQAWNHDGERNSWRIKNLRIHGSVCNNLGGCHEWLFQRGNLVV